MTTPDLREAAQAALDWLASECIPDGAEWAAQGHLFNMTPSDMTRAEETRDALRAALASQPEPLTPPPTLDVERLIEWDRLAEAWANVMDGRRIGAGPGLAARISGGTTNSDDWHAIAEYARLSEEP